MDRRLELQAYLKTITPNVYFQPPSNISMQYPAIVYSRQGLNKQMAANGIYRSKWQYTVTVIDKNPDSPLANKLLELDYCTFSRQFVMDGLNHISFNLYY
jgi:hypothetical protein